MKNPYHEATKHLERAIGHLRYANKERAQEQILLATKWLNSAQALTLARQEA